MKRREFLQSTILALAAFPSLLPKQPGALESLLEEHVLISDWAPRVEAGIRASTDLLTYPGLIGIDFADIRAILGRRAGQPDGSIAVVGFGEAAGENRAIRAAEGALRDLKPQHALLKP
jgi:hypothetical protein